MCWPKCRSSCGRPDVLPDVESLWRWLPVGYVLTVLLETPVLWTGLRADHAKTTRLLAAAWLTGVTYPIVAVALPALLWPHTSYATYLVVAETFAITTEMALFRWRWGGTPRDLAVVGLANVVSAVAGGMLTA